jgi:hypothetical protein
VRRFGTYPATITIFNNNENISIGMIDIRTNTIKKNTQEQFAANYQSNETNLIAFLG